MKSDSGASRETRGITISRWLELGAALLAVGLVTAPILLGGGIDVPDDFLYFDVAGWEWLRHACSAGKSPWFVVGKLGGVSLLGDTASMAPFYPAGWLLALLPVYIFLPLTWMVHAALAMLSTRWCARTFGASSWAATLAGVAVIAGPFGVMALMDGRTEGLPVAVWFPVVLGALERLKGASQRSEQMRWAVLAGMALALLILGTHLRLAGAACATVGLVCLIRWIPLQWASLAGVIGVCGGSPGFLPMMLEARQSASSVNRLAALKGVAEPLLTPGDLPGLLAPRASVVEANHGLGVLLLVAIVLAARSLGQPARRLGVVVVILLLAVLSPQIPGLRFLFAPLLVMTYPVNDIYLGLSVLCAAAVGASALDNLVAGAAGGDELRLRRPAGAVLVFLWLCLVVQSGLGSWVFNSARAWISYGVGALQATAVLLLCLVCLRRLRRSPRQWLRLIFLLGILDLTATGVRMHLTVPSSRILLAGRTEIPQMDDLAGGYLDIRELIDLEGFAYDMTGPSKGGREGDDPSRDERRGLAALIGGGDAKEDWAEVALDVQENALKRFWPVHLGVARGFRGVAGRAKMPPARVVAMLTPLANRLRNIEQQDHSDSDAIEAMFGPGSMGQRVMALFGVPAAVGDDGVVIRLKEPAPWCYSPTITEVVADRTTRVQRLLSAPFRAWGPALLEQALSYGGHLSSAAVDCPSEGEVRVEAKNTSLVVIRESFHPGWQVVSKLGERLATFPVNQVHLGVLVPAGRQQLTVTFRPPGLVESAAAASAAWTTGLLLLLLGWVRKRRRSP